MPRLWVERTIVGVDRDLGSGDQVAMLEGQANEVDPSRVAARLNEGDT
jgi:hypothetical protein